MKTIFVALTVLLLAALPAALLSRPAPAQGFGPAGLQLYTVRSLLERDYPGTLARVAARATFPS